MSLSSSSSASSSSSLANAQAREGLQRLQQSLHASRQNPSTSPASISNDVEASKKLQEGIQDGLLRSRSSQPEPQMTGGGGNGESGSSSSFFYQQGKNAFNEEKRRNFIINTACSFMVLLLAAQSYKSGILKRKADTKREACEEVLQEAQERLKYITSSDVAALIACECLQEIQNQNVPSTSSYNGSWYSSWGQPTLRGSKDASTTMQQSSQIQEDGRHDAPVPLEERLTSLIHGRLTSLLGEFGLSDEEKEKRKVEHLSSSLMIQNSTATNEHDELLAVLNSEILNKDNPEGAIVVRDENGNPIIKKRVFSI
jgi:hypothetical protein